MKRLLAACVLAWCAGVATAAGTRAAVATFEPDSLPRIVAAAGGKPFVLVAWSLDCVYCQASLKALGRHKDLRVVTVLTDPLGGQAPTPLMRAKLGALGVTQDTWAFGAAPPEQLRYALDPGWYGELPRSYWFNAKGERSAHSGIITEAMIGQFLAQGGSR
jgi:hypothetical protein